MIATPDPALPLTVVRSMVAELRATSIPVPGAKLNGPFPLTTLSETTLSLTSRVERKTMMPVGPLSETTASLTVTAEAKAATPGAAALCAIDKCVSTTVGVAFCGWMRKVGLACWPPVTTVASGPAPLTVRSLPMATLSA